MFVENTRLCISTTVPFIQFLISPYTNVYQYKISLNKYRISTLFFTCQESKVVSTSYIEREESDVEEPQVEGQ